MHRYRGHHADYKCWHTDSIIHRSWNRVQMCELSLTRQTENASRWLMRYGKAQFSEAKGCWQSE